MSTPLERAEQAVYDARMIVWMRPCDETINTLVAAVEARCAERLRVNGWFVAADVAGNPMPIGSRVKFGPGEGLVSAPAEACQFHTPAGDPCAADGCGHAAGADCHPKES